MILTAILIGVLGTAVAIWQGKVVRPPTTSPIYAAPVPAAREQREPDSDYPLVAQTKAEAKKWTATLRDHGMNCDSLKEVRYRGPGSYGETYIFKCANGGQFYGVERPNGRYSFSARGVGDIFSDAFQRGFSKGLRGE